MKEFTFYSREDIQAFAELMQWLDVAYDVHVILADPAGDRTVWLVRANKKSSASFTPPAGESAL